MPFHPPQRETLTEKTLLWQLLGMNQSYVGTKKVPGKLNAKALQWNFSWTVWDMESTRDWSKNYLTGRSKNGLNSRVNERGEVDKFPYAIFQLKKINGAAERSCFSCLESKGQ